MILWLCGITTEKNNQAQENEQIDISQTNKEKRFCDIQAIILMSITGFLWVFFNNYKN
jgi:hypothetical protein